MAEAVTKKHEPKEDNRKLEALQQAISQLEKSYGKAR